MNLDIDCATDDGVSEVTRKSCKRPPINDGTLPRAKVAKVETGTLQRDKSANLHEDKAHSHREHLAASDRVMDTQLATSRRKSLTGVCSAIGLPVSQVKPGLARPSRTVPAVLSFK